MDHLFLYILISCHHFWQGYLVSFTLHRSTNTTIVHYVKIIFIVQYRITSGMVLLHNNSQFNGLFMDFPDKSCKPILDTHFVFPSINNLLVNADKNQYKRDSEAFLSHNILTMYTGTKFNNLYLHEIEYLLCQIIFWPCV